MFALPFLSREALWGMWYLIPYIVRLTLINQYVAVQALHWRGFGMWLVVDLSVSVVCHKDVAWPCMSKQLCDLHWWWDTCYNPCHFPLDDMFSLVPNATNDFFFPSGVSILSLSLFQSKAKKSCFLLHLVWNHCVLFEDLSVLPLPCFSFVL